MTKNEAREKKKSKEGFDESHIHGMQPFLRPSSLRIEEGGVLLLR